MDHVWARAIRDQCVAHGNPFFFKQSSGVRTEMGTELIEEDGTRTTWRHVPDPAQVYGLDPQKVAIAEEALQDWLGHREAQDEQIRQRVLGPLLPEVEARHEGGPQP
jgi:hypothetical protein